MKLSSIIKNNKYLNRGCDTGTDRLAQGSPHGTLPGPGQPDSFRAVQGPGDVDLSDPDITMVCSDSRKVEEGGLFIAIEGYKDNGLRYIEDAIKKGARALIVEDKFRDMVHNRYPLPVCYTPNARKCALAVSRVFYGIPSRDLCLVGVTGTNGKTTVTYLIEAILEEGGHNPGVIGTISYRFNDVVRKANNTTPDPIEIQSLFYKMKEGSVDYIVMEVSSHALAMDRIFPEDYDCAIFTNLSQDHLDFHETMDEYFHAKALLFRDLKENAVAIINVDDPYGKKLLGLTKARVFTYGMHSEAHFGGSIDALSITGTNFTVDGKNYTTHLVGEHNVYNLLSAYSFARALGLNNNAFERAMDSVKKIPGRFERVAFDRDYHVFVDYAHTPDALGHLLEAANALKKGRIITVFGCGGDRDRGKRPLMGNVVEKKSDICIVTSDNPRTEDPLAIIGDIKGGLSRSDHLIIPDRRSAIFKAVELVRADDIVLIAGKGHEDYQILKDSIIHFDDREVALEAMEYFGK